MENKTVVAKKDITLNPEIALKQKELVINE